MSDRILLRRGNKVDLPVLNAGEPGFALDTKKLYIGASGGNAQIAMATQESWIAPTLLNSWVNFGGIEATAAYMKDDMGFVHLKGLIKSGVVVSGTPVLTLPVGYRPLQNLQFTSASYNGSALVAARIDILTTGELQIFGGSNNMLSLNIPTFRGEQ